jgi:hypothetical protein
MFVTRTPNGFEPKRDDATSAAEQLARLGIIISARADNKRFSSLVEDGRALIVWAGDRPIRRLGWSRRPAHSWRR